MFFPFVGYIEEATAREVTASLEEGAASLFASRKKL
jgi:hypothetical protein